MLELILYFVGKSIVGYRLRRPDYSVESQAFLSDVPHMAEGFTTFFNKGDVVNVITYVPAFPFQRIVDYVVNGSVMSDQYM